MTVSQSVAGAKRVSRESSEILGIRHPPRTYTLNQSTQIHSKRIAMSKNFPPDGLPLPGEVLLLTDQLFSPADFVLHRLLQAHLKGRSDSKCIILSAHNDLSRWKSIANKAVRYCFHFIEIAIKRVFCQNLNLEQSISSDSLLFVDLVSTSASDQSLNTLKPFFDHVKNIIGSLNASTLSQTLILLDDISILEWIGVPVAELSRFARALSALCRKVRTLTPRK